MRLHFEANIATFQTEVYLTNQNDDIHSPYIGFSGSHFFFRLSIMSPTRISNNNGSSVSAPGQRPIDQVLAEIDTSIMITVERITKIHPLMVGAIRPRLVDALATLLKRRHELNGENMDELPDYECARSECDGFCNHVVLRVYQQAIARRVL